MQLAKARQTSFLVSHQPNIVLTCGRAVIFHYSLYSNYIAIKHSKFYQIIVKTCKNRIMKVEAVVLKPMRALSDGKQVIKFAWPNVRSISLVWYVCSYSYADHGYHD